MPGLNKKGPLGQGPLSGGQKGVCGQNKTVSNDENESLQQSTGDFRGGTGCRRRGGSGRGVGQGSGMGRKTTS